MCLLRPDINFTGGATVIVSGRTSSRQEAIGRRRSVRVNLGEAIALDLWDTMWSTGERELVLATPDPMPMVPTALANLFGRRRAAVEPAPQDGAELMTVRLVVPDASSWPRFRSVDVEELREACYPYVSNLPDVGVMALGRKADLLGQGGRRRDELCAVLDERATMAAPAVYFVTRVLPTLRAVGLTS